MYDEYIWQQFVAILVIFYLVFDGKTSFCLFDQIIVFIIAYLLLIR
jgi:hypothetical protein